MSISLFLVVSSRRTYLDCLDVVHFESSACGREILEFL